MHTLKYRLKKDLIGRAASTLSWALNDLPFYIYIALLPNRHINAKSLVGILSTQLKEGDIIVFEVRYEADANLTKEALNKLDFLQAI